MVLVPLSMLKQPFIGIEPFSWDRHHKHISCWMRFTSFNDYYFTYGSHTLMQVSLLEAVACHLKKKKARKKKEARHLRCSVWKLVLPHSWRQQEMMTNAVCFTWRTLPIAILWTVPVDMHCWILQHTAFHFILDYYSVRTPIWLTPTARSTKASADIHWK